jgi:hypothetical protein
MLKDHLYKSGVEESNGDIISGLSRALVILLLLVGAACRRFPRPVRFTSANNSKMARVGQGMSIKH